MLQLPKNKDGIPYISYSQWTSWNAIKGFNTGLPGRYEYMLSYFFGQEWPDMGWAQFGNEVEDYICERKGAENFDDSERATLERIEPLGLFQHEFLLEFDGFGLLGFIDDASPGGETADSAFKKIRDYKTCSENSSKKYYGEDYYQLDIYAMWVQQRLGRLPEELEVVMVERTGNPFRGGGRDVLKVGGQIWYHQRQTSPERIHFLREDIARTAKEISEAWMVYQKMLSI